MPKPANWRIVHSRPRYIDGYTPRVNGNAPGRPSSASSSTGTVAEVYNGSTSRPEIVENSSPSRSGVAAYRSRHTSSALVRSRCPVVVIFVPESATRSRREAHHLANERRRLGLLAPQPAATISAGTMRLTSTIESTGTFARRAAATIASGVGAS